MLLDQGAEIDAKAGVGGAANGETPLMVALQDRDDELRRRDVVARGILDRVDGIVVPLEIGSRFVLSEAPAHASLIQQSQEPVTAQRWLRNPYGALFESAGQKPDGP